MRAVGYFAPSPITAPDSLVDIELPRPSAKRRDLLVRSPRHRPWRADRRASRWARHERAGFCVFHHPHTADHLKEIVELIAPQGRLALIDTETEIVPHHSQK